MKNISIGKQIPNGFLVREENTMWSCRRNIRYIAACLVECLLKTLRQSFQEPRALKNNKHT